MGVIIRHYLGEDREDLRDIAWDTAFAGQEADIFFDRKNEDILKDFLTFYFTDYEPESCFVAENEGEIVGYLIGAKDTAILNSIFHAKILPRLVKKLITTGALLKSKNLNFFLYSLLGFLKGEFRMPDFYCDYPATLHINLKTRWRGQGLGSRLISSYLDYLKQEKIKGVYLASISDKAKTFFLKQGFHLLYQGRRSYFQYILKKEMPIYIFGKKLS